MTPTGAAAVRAPAPVVAAATLAQTLASLGVATMPVIAPKLAETLAVPVALIGIQVSIAYGCATFAALAGAALERRWGSCRVMQAGLLLGAVGAALGATLPNLAVLALASALLGCAMGAINPPIANLILRFAPAAQLNLLFSIKQTGVPLGHIIAALSAPIIALTIGWQWSLALVAALTAASAIALHPMRRHWDAPRRTQLAPAHAPLEGIRAIWRVAALRYCVLAGACFSVVQSCLAAFAVTMLVAEAEFTLVQAGALLSMINVASVAARLFWGWISDRLRSAFPALVAIGCIIVGACVAIGFLTPAWPVLAVNAVCFAFGTTALGWNGILNAEIARNSAPGQAGVTASGAAFFVFGAFCLGPTLFAGLYQLIGRFASTFAALALLAALGAVCVMRARAATLRSSGGRGF